MQLSKAARAGMIGRMFPKWEDKLWAKIPENTKLQILKRQVNKEKSIHKKQEKLGKMMQSYKKIEQKFTPSQEYRKIAVDWPTQLARNTLVVGKPFEGPNGMDYRPGRDQVANPEEPFTEAEWNERQKHRTFDILKLGAGIALGTLTYYIITPQPTVWV